MPAASAEIDSAPAAVTRGRGHRPRDSAQLSVGRLTRRGEVAALAPQWRDLYEGTASRNPFASPDWTGAWLDRFVREDELAVVTVRRDGRLIGVAPCYVRTAGRAMRTVQLAGTARVAGLTELPQVLTAPGEARSVLRAVVGHWMQDSRQWDWLELPLDAGQGWFEPQWLGDGRAVQGLVQHKTTRAAVVLPLPDDPSALRGLLKRNVWESVKRARNRLGNSGRAWEVTAHTTEAELAVALPALRRLHGARSAIDGRRTHPDVLGDPERYAFVADVVTRMAASSRAEILTLDVEGEPVAAQLVLRAPSASYLTISGLAPDWWQAGPVTLLQYSAIERAVARGDAELNFSVGPDISKLRWSENVVQHPEFVVCGPRSRSRWLLAGYAAVASVAAVRREARRHQVHRAQRGVPTDGNR